jgi:hypothetical protein
MSNGGTGGGTVPEMPAAVWNTIKNATWRDDGWNIGGTTKWLHEKEDTWGLYDSSPPARWVKAPMDETYWDSIAGGTLETAGNWIITDSVKWYVYFYERPASSQTHLVP